MKRTHLVIAALVAVLAGLLVWILVGRGGADGAGDGERGRARPGVAGAPIPAEVVAQQEAREVAARRTADPPDPAGHLLLEGQVLGEDDQPVGGAAVWISTVPPRSATSEADGGFRFDRLLPREYALSARHDGAIGGPVMVAMGPGAEPVVIRLREGARLTVRVTAAADGTPVAGAAVELRELGKPTAMSDDRGIATFTGLGAGWSVVTARATGFAPAGTATAIGGPGSQQEVSLALRRGAALSGRVVDEAGAPIAGAYVTLRDASTSWALGGDATTAGDDGAFAFPVVAAGSYTLAARDGEHAPGTSEILTVDGVSPRTGVTIVLTAGGVLRGRVIDRQRQPAPFAAVAVAPQGGDGAAGAWMGFEGGARRVTADEAGRFEMKGLPRGRARARAENDVAASAITDVDLTSQAVIEELELMLDVEGTIAGTVVDAAGEPVAEAQVSAMTDLFSAEGAGQLEDFVFAGFTGTSTDGGGAFRIRGLPEGAYRLRASRSGGIGLGMFASEGTLARTGDTDVRIVLPAPGGLEGRIAFADGTVPAHALVAVGVLPATPTRDGAFAVHDLPPGRYDVRIRGDQLAALVRRDVIVTAGAVTDLGTLTVKRGRTVSGRVVDPAGRPVAGARVLAGERLFSEGAGGGNLVLEEQLGLRHTTSGPDGSFTVVGAPEKGGAVMAEHPEMGRSDALPFPPGEQPVTGLGLPLRGFGSITGKVTMEGEAVPSVQVMASARGSAGHVVVVATGRDGTFVIDKIPEGEHRVSANRMHNFQLRSASMDVRVTAGQRARADLVIPIGEVTLTVEIKGKDGARIDAAQIFLFRGAVTADNAKEVSDRFMAGDAAGMNLWFGGADFPTFDQLPAGGYSVCVLPINGNLADLQFQQRLQEHLEHLDVHCKAVTVAARPLSQRHVATVPVMKPLPDE
jgi:protocatechuate 3,4-dioxygenase beta subunit